MTAGTGVLPAAAEPSRQPGAQLPAATATWFLAPSLVALRAEIDARWPGRSTSSDGSIGDSRHESSDNGHNPVGHQNGPTYGTKGAVHALDITAAGIDTDRVLRAVVGDARVRYVIFNGRIWQAANSWVATRQWGDPHTSHIHVSLRDENQWIAVTSENDTSRWLSGSTKDTKPKPATLSVAQTKALQSSLISRGYSIPAGATGSYGPATTAAVAAFQRSQGWVGSAADGIAGPLTLQRLGVTSARDSLDQSSRSSSARSTAAPAALQVGISSKRVYELQQALLKRGFAIPAGATGYFGVRTRDAVRAFQRAQGWSGSQADGIPGPRTLALLGL